MTDPIVQLARDRADWYRRQAERYRARLHERPDIYGRLVAGFERDAAKWERYAEEWAGLEAAS